MNAPPPKSRSAVPMPGYPVVEWLDPFKLARWTFATADRPTQEAEFRYWRGWFGFEEDDEPERIEGRVWYTRPKRPWS